MGSLAQRVPATALRIFAAAVAVSLAFAISAALIAAAGVSPTVAFRAMLEGSVGTPYSVSVTLVRMTPVLLAGLGVALAFRARVFNIGAEGQLYLGAMAATAVALTVPVREMWILLPLAVTAGFVGGAAWALVPGYLRAYRGVSEIVVTLMFNFVAIHLTRFMLNTNIGPLGEKGAAALQSPPIPLPAQLPVLVPGTSVHAGLLLGLAAAVCLFVILRFSAAGFRVRALGASPAAASYAGIATARVTLVVMLVSGGLAGLAGASEVLGLKYRLFADFSPGYGYEAIAVALLARNNPLAVLPAAAFFAALDTGATHMQQTLGVESAVALIVQALVVLVLIAGVQLRWTRPTAVRPVAEPREGELADAP